MAFDVDYAVSLLPILFNGMLITFQATALGMALAISWGGVLAVGSLSRRRMVYIPARCYIEFFRLTPFLVQLFFIFYVLPRYGIRLSALTCGVISLGLYFSAYVAEAIRTAIRSIPRGQWEAAIALNMPRHRVWGRIILPQTLLLLIPIIATYAIAMLKESALLSTITVTELLGAALQEAALTYRYTEAITMVGIIFLIMSSLSSLASSYLENKLRKKYY